MVAISGGIRAAVLLVAVATVAASTLTVFDTSDCGGHNTTYTRCGCHNIDFRAGYNFTFAGGVTANLHDGRDCGGKLKHLDGNDPHCGSFAYQSVCMCPPGKVKLGMGPVAVSREDASVR